MALVVTSFFVVILISSNKKFRGLDITEQISELRFSPIGFCCLLFHLVLDQQGGNEHHLIKAELVFSHSEGQLDVSQR